MMDEYEATTDDIRSAFVDYSESADFPTQKHYLDWKATGGAEGEFDRWLAAHDRVVAANAWDECDAGRSKLPRCPVCDDRTVSQHYGGGIPGWRHDDDGTLICGGSFTEPVWKDMNPYRITEENN